LGAAEVVVGLAGMTEPVFGVFDNVGGPLLTEAFSLLADGGSAQSIGMASNQPTTIDFEAERQFAVRKRLEPFTVRTPFGPDLAYLVELLEAGEIDPQIGCGCRGTKYRKRPRHCSTAGSPARRYWTWPDGS
jgi:NADPH:quinone reductase-like Zn-dependent oxidoreductase